MVEDSRSSGEIRRFRWFDYIPTIGNIVVGGEVIELRQNENQLLQYFLDNPKRVISRRELNLNVFPDARSLGILNKGIRGLRAKIEPDPKNPQVIVTKSRKGYIFCDLIEADLIEASPTLRALRKIGISSIDKAPWNRAIADGSIDLITAADESRAVKKILQEEDGSL